MNGRIGGHRGRGRLIKADEQGNERKKLSKRKADRTLQTGHDSQERK